VRSPFAEILRQAVEATPGALGGAFAASDGEMVDYFARRDAFEWALFTAHYGVVLSHVQLALNTWHYGEASMVMIEHKTLAILIHSVKDGYYALMALGHPAPLGRAIQALSRAAAHLREEMS
jgi:predicted regulator of Ras-like GTPase activity (Roadblock/LC7/MglB family)